MFLTSGYVLIVCVLVKSDFLHTFKRDFLKKSWTFLSLGCSMFLDILGRSDIVFDMHSNEKSSSLLILISFRKTAREAFKAVSFKAADASRNLIRWMLFAKSWPSYICRWIVSFNERCKASSPIRSRSGSWKCLWATPSFVTCFPDVDWASPLNLTDDTLTTAWWQQVLRCWRVLAWMTVSCVS